MSNGPKKYRPCAGCGKPCSLGMIDNPDRWVCWDCKDKRDCDIEFGEHDHDDAECARTLAGMEGEPWDDGLADALNREAEEAMLGRPLFPNEY